MQSLVKRLGQAYLPGIYVFGLLGQPAIVLYFFNGIYGSVRMVRNNVKIKKLGFQKVRMDHSFDLTKYEPIVSHGDPV